jgi:hypothetical protein
LDGLLYSHLLDEVYLVGRQLGEGEVGQVLLGNITLDARQEFHESN